MQYTLTRYLQDKLKISVWYSILSCTGVACSGVVGKLRMLWYSAPLRLAHEGSFTTSGGLAYDQPDQQVTVTVV